MGPSDHVCSSVVMELGWFLDLHRAPGAGALLKEVPPESLIILSSTSEKAP